MALCMKVTPSDSSLGAEYTSALINRISVCRSKEMLNNQYNHDFIERATEEKGLSREDRKFMEIMERSATLNPFRAGFD